MGNQQTGRTRSDTYTRYERDGEDGRYVTLEQHDLAVNNHPSSIDERVILLIKTSNLFRFIFGRFLRDIIQVYQYVYAINGKYSNIIVNKHYRQNHKMKRRQLFQ
jgi:hypothetical protein